MQQSPPITFGSRQPDVDYKLRPAAYAVITRDESEVAVVKGKRGYFLPGGGCWSGETPEETVIREVREELAREVHLVRKIGDALQYFSVNDKHYEMPAVFFEATFVNEPHGQGEFELLWVALNEADQIFFHECQAWAVRQLSR
ncbi:MAG: NUDIX domain-containing protein [bacterium]